MKGTEQLVIADNKSGFALARDCEDMSVGQQRKSRNKPRNIWALLM